MSVGKDVDVKIELEKSAHSVAIANDSSLHADEVLRVSLDLDAVGPFIELRDMTCIRPILVDQSCVVVHEGGYILHSVVSCNIVVISVCTSIIVNGG
jgi:hypothetical protein